MITAGWVLRTLRLTAGSACALLADRMKKAAQTVVMPTLHTLSASGIGSQLAERNPTFLLSILIAESAMIG